MARPIISPVSINSTAPETFVVLNQRMRVVEEQTNELLKDLRTLDVKGQSVEIFPSKPLEKLEGHQSISPVRAQTVFGGTNDTLWRTCETLVNRMCRLESVVQTLKLNMFRLQTEKELNPKHAANLEQRMKMIQEEHMEELRVLQEEGRMLCQQLQDSREEESKARDRVEKLRSALEIATATKRDVAIAADELRATKKKMDHKIQELTEQLAKESSQRESLQESHAVLLYQMNDLEMMVEKERKQVHTLQQDCNTLRQDIQMSGERLQKEEERKIQLEQQCMLLKSNLESQEATISKFSEEAKITQMSLSKALEENAQLQAEITSLREVAEKVQMLNEELTQQCTELSSTLRTVTMENAQLITKHQAALKLEQEKIDQKLKEQDLILDTARASIIEELRTVQNEKAQLQKEIEALRSEHADCKQKTSKVEEIAQIRLLESVVAKLQSELEAALQEKETLLKDKETQEQEMQKTLHQMKQDNKRLETEVEESKLEIGPLKKTVEALEEENKKLMEHEAVLQYQQHTQQQVKQVLEGLANNKNKLAYDKGKLQINAELDSVRINTQRLEVQLKQSQSALACREQDYSDTVKTCDEVLRENQKLKGQISATEGREKHKLGNLRRKLEESKEDNAKMTNMLENVLASHSKMQMALEKVQTELGRKDAEIAGLKKDRTQSQQRIQKLEAELEQCHNQLVFESQLTVKTGPLRKALEASKAEKKKLAQNLEQALQTNSILQSKLLLLQDELERKETEYQQLLECRDQLIEETKMEAKLYTDRLETLKKQFQTEREVTKKAAQKESTELKKALEEACSKSGDLSRCNRELRAKVVELESALVAQKERVKKQKSLITQYFNSKSNNARNVERMKEIESELKQMEDLKEQYQKKNYEQSVSIKQFVTELTSLQSEMQQLAKNQQAMAAENRNLESQLEQERKRRKQLEDECKTLEDTIKHLRKCKEHTEQKLKEAGLESQQITANLEEAHQWFKSKFDSLQRELATSRQQKSAAEHNFEEEEKPVRLPSQVCLKRWEMKNHLKFISRKYLNELNQPSAF
ncbi:coiled-coil domain-containing protein 150 isoform X2 [Anolis sagrei]|uniref:coiled-coil domain-containing protein 150 isoform X2 n=1 Tax=Anolis sagrei TaxID=38937 RepID=UPI00351FC8F4